MTIPLASKLAKNDNTGTSPEHSTGPSSADTDSSASRPLLLLQQPQDDGRIFLSFFLKFVCPLLALFILCANPYGPSLRLSLYAWPIKYYHISRQWEAAHGPLIREYFFEGKHDKWIQKPPVYDFEAQLGKLPKPPLPSNESCAAVEKLRFDCFPRGVVSEAACKERGCCYQPATESVPSCFYPRGYASYVYKNLTVNEKNISAELTANFESPYPKQYPTIYLNIIFINANSLEIVYSPFDIPHPTTGKARASDKVTAADRSYTVDINANLTGFRIIRKSNGKPIFDSQNMGGLLMSEQFAQLSTALPSKYIYGLEQRSNSFPLDTNWNTVTLFNHDAPPHKANGYGTYPSYICLEGDGKAHAVHFASVPATDFRLQPGGLTVRSLSGLSLSFAVTLGETPRSLYINDNQFITPLPPFWALGFHFSRFGFKDTADLKATYERIKNAQIPFDTQWTDIDYMDQRNDFTLSPKFKELPKFVDELHKEGMHYVLILDPGVSGSEKPGTYPPYDDGIKMDIFVKDSSGKKPLVGKVWNRESTVFPDFTNPKALDYWMGLIESFHKKLAFDGIWLDMNEPSNFVNGSVKGCPMNSFENPPYSPEVEGGVLNYHTLCMSALHYRKVPHYYLHNDYANFEAFLTSFALAQVREERSFVISRAGNHLTSAVAGIWTGDVWSTWEDMRQSVRDLMTFNLLHQPLVGADICGFNGNTTKPLCQRWYQVGAFYPFSRSHNTDDGIDQDPVALGIEDSVRAALNVRYSLLPYLYSLFWEQKHDGLPVVRPTFFMFPDQEDTYTLDTQFFWGDAVLVIPALDESLEYVKAYIGNGVWYNLKTLRRLPVTGTKVVLPAPPDEIPLLLRGGYIVPMFNVDGATTTKQLRDSGSLRIVVPLNDTGGAAGFLFWDDGVKEEGPYSIVQYKAFNKTLKAELPISSYKDNLRIDEIHVTSVDSVSNVTLDDKPCQFNFNATTKILIVEPKISAYQNFVMTWS